MVEVTAVDPKTRTVTTREGQSYQGDFLVLAAGSHANFFGTKGAEQNAFPLYSIQEAQHLRSRILTVFEDADRDPTLVGKGALNFVVVGGGTYGYGDRGCVGRHDQPHHDGGVRRPRSETRAVYLIDHGHALLGRFR
jgi:NADH dehydrogenase